VPAPTSRKATP